VRPRVHRNHHQPDALRIFRNDLAHETKGFDDYELHQVVEANSARPRIELLGSPDDVVNRVLDAS
jgi:hypothetical protein